MGRGPRQRGYRGARVRRRLRDDPVDGDVVDKTAGTAIDANGDGLIGPGDTLEYVVSIAEPAPSPSPTS